MLPSGGLSHVALSHHPIVIPDRACVSGIYTRRRFRQVTASMDGRDLPARP